MSPPPPAPTSGIEEKVRTIVARIRRDGHAADEPVPGGRDLFTAGILDSLATLEYIAEIETCFGISLPNEELIPQNLWTIDATAALVARHV